MSIIRLETQSDRLAVNLINEAAFGRQAEATLVDCIREKSADYLSFVAEQGDMIVGHIFFSEVSIESSREVLQAMALGPMAVLPLYQNQGIGSLLVTRGLEELRRLGHGVVVVLGHSWFYPRFGFVQARQKNLVCEFSVADDVFMVAELIPGALDGKQGRVKYHDAFHRV